MNQQTYQLHAKVGTWGEVIILVCQDKISKTNLRSLSQRETTWYEKDHITNRWKNAEGKAKKLLVLKEVLVNKRNIKDLYTKCLNKGNEAVLYAKGHFSFY